MLLISRTKYWSGIVHKVIAVIFLMISFGVQAGAKCHGHFINPITHVDWKALFPLYIAGVKVAKSSNDATTVATKSGAICTCSDRQPFVYGVPIAFWQPFRAVDVTRKPYCMVNLGGMEVPIGVKTANGDIANNIAADLGRSHQVASYHVHWYVYPLLLWMNILTDVACMEHEDFDVAYMTELDPMWGDDELSSWIAPESLIFSNPIAQSACIADCAASSFATPIDSLFWCAGCQGGIYPISATIAAHQSAMDSTTLAAERMLFKMHRQGLLHGSMGKRGMCGKYPMLWWKKSQYKLQVVNPSINKDKINSTNAIGKTVLPWSFAKDLNPANGDFGYLVWRRKECCVF